MKNTWLGYLSSVLMVLAGVLMFIGEKPVVGTIFILIAITGLILRMYMNKNKPEN